MEPHHLEEQTRLLLLESAASPLAADSGGEESRYVGEKLMEKRSLVFELNKLPSVGIGMGKCIESDPFMVGGHNFRLQLYTYGFKRRFVSLGIKNESEKAVQLVADLERLIRSHYSLRGYNSFDDRESEYRRVVTLEPGGQLRRFEKFEFRFYWIRLGDPLVFRATIGAFVDDDDDDKLCLSPPLERCLLFQVGDCRYFAHKAVIASRCPALLLDCSQSDHIVILLDVERHVFEAVLWFINNYTMHWLDKRAIFNSRGDSFELDKKGISNSGGDSFTLKILAAADRFHLKDLKRLCECNSELLRCYYELEIDTKRAWRWLSQKMKEVIPQKMKEA